MLGDITTHIIHKADQPTDRRQDILHPSEMSHDDWCPRASYYRIRDVKAGKELKPEQFAVGTLKIFDEGHSVHAKYQGYLREMGRLKGLWLCTDCGIKIAYPDDPGQCEECGSRASVVYGEVPLNAEKEALIVGHADGWVEPRWLIEIKTVGMGTVRMDAPALLRAHTHETTSGKKLVDLNGLWDDLSRPFPPHVKQANIYLWIAALRGIDVDEMEFIYEYKANQQTKSFTIKPSRLVMDPLLAKAKTVKMALETGEPPEREFSKKDKKPCSNCPWLDECYEESKPDRRSRRSAREESGEGESRPVRGRRSSRGSEQDPPRADRNRRRRSHGAVLGDDSVGELPRHAPQQGTGSRKVRRIRPRNSTSERSPG